MFTYAYTFDSLLHRFLEKYIQVTSVQGLSVIGLRGPSTDELSMDFEFFVLVDYDYERQCITQGTIENNFENYKKYFIDRDFKTCYAGAIFCKGRTEHEVNHYVHNILTFKMEGSEDFLLFEL